LWQSNLVNPQETKLRKLSPYALLGIEICINIIPTVFSKLA
jgi:hypothetical protein